MSGVNYLQDRLDRPGIPKVRMSTFVDRDATLKAEGFIWWERFWLSQHTIHGPAIEYVRAERQGWWQSFGEKCQREGKVTQSGALKLEAVNEWRHLVTELYRRNGWFFHDGTFAPFRMVDDAQAQGSGKDAITPQPKIKKRRDNAHIKDSIRQKRKKPLREMSGYGRRLPNL